MPHDFPNAAFCASVFDGGLGIPCMRWSIPRMARRRLGDLSERTKILLTKDGRLIESAEQQRKMFRNDLLRMVNCQGLQKANEVPVCHAWILDGTAFLSGKDYIKSIHLRYNCLYNKSRASRRRPDKDKFCKRCKTV